MIKCSDGEMMEYVNVEVSLDTVVMKFHVVGNKNPGVEVFEESGVDMWAIGDIESLVVDMLGIISGAKEIIIE